MSRRFERAIVDRNQCSLRQVTANLVAKSVRHDVRHVLNLYGTIASKKEKEIYQRTKCTKPLSIFFESSFRCERQPFDPHNPPSPPFLALSGVRILHRVSFAQTAPGSATYSCGFLLANLSSVAWENWCAFAPILPPNGAGAKASYGRAKRAG